MKSRLLGQLYGVNITSQSLSNYERGLREPDGELLARLAGLYGVSVDWLLGLRDNPRPEGDLNPEDLRVIRECLMQTVELAIDRIKKIDELLARSGKREK